MNPIIFNLSTHDISGQIIAVVELKNNNGFVKGMCVPISFGNDLHVVNVQKGNIWGSGDFYFVKEADRELKLCGATLGSEAVISGDGSIAVITFDVSGANDEILFTEAAARSSRNNEIQKSYEYINTAVSEFIDIPAEYQLLQNYPNPFNPTTTIYYGLKEPGLVTISLYNIHGQLVKTLLQKQQQAGSFHFEFDAKTLPSGVYFYRIDVNGFTKKHKMILLR